MNFNALISSLPLRLYVQVEEKPGSFDWSTNIPTQSQAANWGILKDPVKDPPNSSLISKQCIETYRKTYQKLKE